MTERDKMLAGEVYHAADAELVARRRRARDLLHAYNRSRDAEAELRAGLLRGLFGAMGTDMAVEPPFFCDCGENIRLGDRVFFNVNCVVAACRRACSRPAIRAVCCAR